MNIQNLLDNKKGMSRKNILKLLELPQMPESLEKTITKRLNSIKNKINGRKDINYFKEIQNAFCDIMVTILGKYREYFFIVDDNLIFNKESFIESQKSEERLFYKELTETQSFIQFLAIEKEEIKNRNNLICKIDSTPKYGRTYENIYADHSLYYKRKNIMKNENISNTSHKKYFKSFFKFGKNDTESDIMIDSSRNKDSDMLDNSLEEALKISNIRSQLNKNYNNLRLLLMPYFIENHDNNLDNEQKIDFIQNEMNQILGLDNEIEKLLNVHNLPYYILPSYKRYNFDAISYNNNNQRYFIGSLYHRNLSNFNDKLGENVNQITSDEIYAECNINENIYIEKANGIKQKKVNYQKIDNWFKYVCFPNNKIPKINDNEIIPLLGNKNYRCYLINMIYQYNLSSDDFLKYIKEESMIKLANITSHILAKISRDEFIMGKLITCACFNYYTMDKKSKKIYLLVDILKQLNNEGNFNCSAWKTYEFWTIWIKDDLRSKENDIDNYLDESFNNYGQKIEYYFISRITRIMHGLGIDKSLIDELIFQNLALKFLNHYKIEDLRVDFITYK